MQTSNNECVTPIHFSDMKMKLINENLGSDEEKTTTPQCNNNNNINFPSCALSGVPSLPLNYHPRSQYVNIIVNALLGDQDRRELTQAGENESVCLIDGHADRDELYCTGQTTLCAAVCHDERIRQSFDIVIWLSTTTDNSFRDADIYLKQILQAILSYVDVTETTLVLDSLNEPGELRDFIQHLASLIKVLLVFDELDSRHIFGILTSLGCKVLINTHLRSIVEGYAACRTIEIQPFSENEMISVIQKSVGTSDISGSTCRTVLFHAKGCPLLVSVLTTFKAFLPQLSCPTSSSPKPRTSGRTEIMLCNNVISLTNLSSLWNSLVDCIFFQLFIKVLTLFPLFSPMPLDIVRSIIQRALLTAVPSTPLNTDDVLDTLQQSGLIVLSEGASTEVMILVSKRIETSLRRWFWTTGKTHFKECWLEAADVWFMAEIIVEYSLCSRAASHERVLQFFNHLSCLSSSLGLKFQESTDKSAKLAELYDSCLTIAESYHFKRFHNSTSSATLCSNFFPRSSVLLSPNQRPMYATVQSSVVGDGANSAVISLRELLDYVHHIKTCVTIVQTLASSCLSDHESVNKDNVCDGFLTIFLDTAAMSDTVSKWSQAWLDRTKILIEECAENGHISLISKLKLNFELRHTVTGNDSELSVKMGCLRRIHEELFCGLMDSGILDYGQLIQCAVTCYSLTKSLEVLGDFEEALRTLQTFSLLVQQIPDTCEQRSASLKILIYFKAQLPLIMSKLLVHQGKVKDARVLLESQINRLVSLPSAPEADLFLQLYTLELGVLLKTYGQPKRGMKFLDQSLARYVQPSAVMKYHPVVLDMCFAVASCCSQLAGAELDPSRSDTTVPDDKYLSMCPALVDEVIRLTQWQHPIESMGYLERLLLAYRVMWRAKDCSTALAMLSRYMTALNNSVEYLYQCRGCRKSLLFAPSSQLVEGWIPRARTGDSWEEYIHYRSLKLLASFVSRILFYGYCEVNDLAAAKTVIYRARFMLAGDVADDPAVHSLMLQNRIFAPYCELRDVYCSLRDLMSKEGDISGSLTCQIDACIAQGLVCGVKYVIYDARPTERHGLFEDELEYLRLLAELVRQMIGTDSMVSTLNEFGEQILIFILNQLETISFLHTPLISEPLAQYQYLFHQNVMAMTINALHMLSTIYVQRGRLSEGHGCKICAICLFIREFHSDYVVDNGPDALVEDHCADLNLLDCLEALSEVLQPIQVQVDIDAVADGHESQLSDVLWLNRDCLLNEINIEIDEMKERLPDIEETRQIGLLRQIETYLSK